MKGLFGVGVGGGRLSSSHGSLTGQEKELMRVETCQIRVFEWVSNYCHDGIWSIRRQLFLKADVRA